MDAKRIWAGGTVALCVLILAAGWFGLVAPQHKKVSSYHAQTTVQEQTQQQLRSELVMLTQQAKQLPEQQALLAKAQNYIPATPSEPSLIRQMTAAADNAGVDLQTMSPTDPTLVAAGTAPATSSSTSSTASGSSTSAAAAPAAPSTIPLYQIQVGFTMVGSYFEVEQFLENLESLPRSIEVTTLTVAPGGVTEEQKIAPTPTTSPGAGSTASTSSTSGPAYNGELIVTLTTRVFMTPTNLAGAGA